MPDNECPTCGKQLRNRHGLRVHHGTAHDERLPNRACDSCESEFYSEYEKKYCSEECRSESVSYEGSDNPNYRGGKETTTCELCDDTFEYYPSDKDGLYCPQCVETEPWRETPLLEGPQNPRWQGGTLELDCAVCGDTVERYPSDVHGEVTLCDRDCLSDWLSEEFAGEGHPNWEGGDVGNYGSGWNGVRREALDRDGHECVLCGTTREELGRNPDVHHVVPVRVYDAAEGRDVADAHRMENVVTLCPPCHRRAEFGHVERGRLWEAIGVAEEGRPRPTVDAANG